MDEKEFKEHISKSLEEDFSQRPLLGDTPTEEMKSYMEGRGYTVEPSEIDFGPTLKDLREDLEEGKNYKHKIYFCKDKEGHSALNLDAAYVLEKERERKEQEKEDRKVFHCNKCGESMMKVWAEGDPEEKGSAYGAKDIMVSGGYLSDPLEDTLTYEFSLCEKCLYKMFLEFKVPPKIGCYI